jgi:hypothetical protein
VQPESEPEKQNAMIISRISLRNLIVSLPLYKIALVSIEQSST